MKNLFLYLMVLGLMTSCVAYSKFEDVRKSRDAYRNENDTLKTKILLLNTENSFLMDSIRYQNKRIEALSLDTTLCQNSLRKMAANYELVNKTYELLVKEKKQLLEGNENEKKELAGKLKETQNELNKTALELEKLSKEIELKKTELTNLISNLTTTQQELQKNTKELEENKKALEDNRKELEIKEKKVSDLQKILNRQDSAVKALKKSVSDALLGFENNGLTVQIRNSKVYVSLDENLLFASASTEVDKKGVEALVKLAKLLEQNPEINIMIEGHTDNVPYKGKGEIKDNWDLSVMRATSVAKILLKNSKIDPKRITVAGRGEYFPVDPDKTPSARQKNRRTEIILTPKLDQLFNILESN